jgi:hypothetical protein
MGLFYFARSNRQNRTMSLFVPLGVIPMPPEHRCIHLYTDLFEGMRNNVWPRRRFISSFCYAMGLSITVCALLFRITALCVKSSTRLVTGSTSGQCVLWRREKTGGCSMELGVGASTVKP